MNLSVFVSTIVALTLKCLYFKYPDLNPVLLIGLKANVGMIGLLVISGRNTIKHL